MTQSDLFVARWKAVAKRLIADDADALVLSKGFDLVYLTGYEAHALERINAFVGLPGGPADSYKPRCLQADSPALVGSAAGPLGPVSANAPGADDLPQVFAPKLEAPLVPRHPQAFGVIGWTDDEDPISMIVDMLGAATRVVISDEMWAAHLLQFQQMMPDTTFVSVTSSLGGLRSIKSEIEMQAIQTVGGLANQIAAQIQRGEVPLIGRSELEIQTDLTERLLAVGHETVEFCIVASGPNSASPHHHPGDRVVQPNEMILFDFGGKHKGYCSDITRCVWTGPIPDEVAATYGTLKSAQQAAFDAARPGARLGDVDAAARDIIADSGFGEHFVHRTGHGIGTEVHEQPYVKAGAEGIVEVGHAFSIEPGIYLEGKWGMRLEDIVVIVDDGAIRCTTTNHDLVEVNA